MALSVVPSEPQDESAIAQAIIADARNGARPVDLERTYGKTRQQIRYILKKNEIKPLKIKDSQPRERLPAVVREKPVYVQTLKTLPKTGTEKQWSLWAPVSSLIGAVLLVIGLVLNCQYWFTIGGDSVLVSVIFCVMGGTIDVITASVPSMATEMWKRKNRIFAILASAVWFPVALVSLVASAGFAGMHMGDTIQARGDIMSEKERLSLTIKQKEKARSAVDGTGLPDVIEVQIQAERGRIPSSNLTKSNDCTNTTVSGPVCERLQKLRIDKINAQKRIDLDTELELLNSRYSAMPSIASKDPASERSSRMTGGYIKPEEVSGYVMNVVAALPALAGLFFAFAIALRR